MLDWHSPTSAVIERTRLGPDSDSRDLNGTVQTTAAPLGFPRRYELHRDAFGTKGRRRGLIQRCKETAIGGHQVLLSHPQAVDGIEADRVGRVVEA